MGGGGGGWRERGASSSVHVAKNNVKTGFH